VVKCGLVGLPNVGKSSLFNKLTNSYAPAENYPFCTIECQNARIIVPDERLDLLAQLEGSAEVIPAHIILTDIAGLVEGAAQGKGMGNMFLKDIREVDALLHIVRTFEDDDVFHVKNLVDPMRDLEIITAELICADCQVIERLLKGKKSADIKMLSSLLQWLESGKLASTFEDQKSLENLYLLTSKPMIILANGKDPHHIENAKNWAITKGLPFVSCSITEDEEFNVLVKTIYAVLKQISYFTCGPKEARAWTIPMNTTAPLAASRIHTDFQKKFIRGQIISYKDFHHYKSIKEAIAKGKRRIEGKLYIVQDGDIINWLTTP
jgi:ribosome-binding ATPase